MSGQERSNNSWKQQNYSRQDWDNDIRSNGEWQPRNGYNSQYNQRNHYESGRNRDRDEYYRHDGDSRRENGHQQNSHQQYDPRRRRQPPHRGGVDLQPYTRNDNGGDWETVSSRSSNRQSQLGGREGSSWQDARDHQQHNQSPPTSTAEMPFMLMLVGIPGSGKSTFATTLESAAPSKYVRINQDTLGSRRKCEDATRRALQQNKCPVIDRCNFDPSQRQYFVDIAREYRVPVHVVSLELPKQTCIQRSEARQNHETIRPGDERMVVNKMLNMFEAPHASEGFVTVERVSNDHQVNELMQEYMSYGSR